MENSQHSIGNIAFTKHFEGLGAAVQAVLILNKALHEPPIQQETPTQQELAARGHILLAPNLLIQQLLCSNINYYLFVCVNT
ncbi:unnamed protein product [Gongylonema pulchrum]|uniref:CAS_CSE1 domain-containing protein n=1 Tax=Gongylonema pulchrum TaxID=637853 RepID=A0A183EPI3_9BILA|nr:unnamed protein product [Gongylonema pulchrum]